MQEGKGVEAVSEFTQEQLEAAKEARRAYDRAWYAKNKEKVRQRQCASWVRKAEREKAEKESKREG